MTPEMQAAAEQIVLQIRQQAVSPVAGWLLVRDNQATMPCPICPKTDDKLGRLSLQYTAATDKLRLKCSSPGCIDYEE